MEIMGLIYILNQFRNKKVFITGHTGFKGSWLTFLLDYCGAITKGYSLEPKTNPSLYLNLTFSNKHSSIYSDISDYDKLQKEVALFKPEFIFHLAAQPLVLESYEDPKITFNTNFNGTLNLLEVLRNTKISCTSIFITTDKVYENKELNIPFSEDDKLGGTDPYSASKAACEVLINSYQKSFFKDSKIHIASVRAGNVIGGGDWSENRLMPDIIRSIFNKKPLHIRNPEAIRPWQHILEPLYGYLMLANALSKDPSTYSTAWNFGPEINDIKSVEEIIRIAKTYDFQIKIQGTKDINKNEAKYLSLNIDKVKQKLNWNPKWSSELAIKMTLNWYRKFYEKETANKLIEENIKMYNNT
tara:strand:+ start:4076 stop:5146 length:1071 start_codon:yes stop_codon:yes gene_type:complete